MDIRQLRHFLALAETLHFVRAANMLHITQPPLSISIKNLEAELGGPLFVRSNRKTELTELGKALVEPARRAVQALEEVGGMSQAMMAGEAGNLVISYPNGATHRLLPRVLPEFALRYPRINVQLREATSAETIDMLNAQDVDIGMVYYPIASDRPYIPIPGEEDQLVAIFPQDYPLARKSRIKLADLAEHPFITFTQTKAPTLPTVVSMACQRAGFSPRIAHYAPRVETVISLVRSGIGIALVPRICAETYSHVIAVRPLSDHVQALKIGLAVMLPNCATNARAVNFLRLMNIEPA